MARRVQNRQEATQPRPLGKPFAKGKSGNPGGLPAWVKEMRELAGSHAPDAIARLAALMRGRNPAVAKAAADSLLDRAGLKAFSLEPDQLEVVLRNESDPIAKLSALIARRLVALGAGPCDPQLDAAGSGRAAEQLVSVGEAGADSTSG